MARKKMIKGPWLETEEAGDAGTWNTAAFFIPGSRAPGNFLYLDCLGEHFTIKRPDLVSRLRLIFSPTHINGGALFNISLSGYEGKICEPDGAECRDEHGEACTVDFLNQMRTFLKKKRISGKTWIRVEYEERDGA